MIAMKLLPPYLARLWPAMKKRYFQFGVLLSSVPDVPGPGLAHREADGEDQHGQRHRDRNGELPAASRFRELCDDDFTCGFVLRRWEDFASVEARTWWVDGAWRLTTAQPRHARRPAAGYRPAAVHPADRLPRPAVRLRRHRPPQRWRAAAHRAWRRAGQRSPGKLRCPFVPERGPARELGAPAGEEGPPASCDSLRGK